MMSQRVVLSVPRVRRPTVAGYFYPREPAQLCSAISQLMGLAPLQPREARLVIAPHSSFPFSGAVAAAVFSALRIPACAPTAVGERWLILGTNHTGAGPTWSVMPDGAYQTPLGEVPVETALAGELLARCPVLVADEVAHRGEHAIEVQLPWLQWSRPAGLTIIPIITRDENPDACRHVAQAIAELVRGSRHPLTVLISSDLSHYESREQAVAKDAALLQAIHARDADRFLGCVREQAVRLCGTGALACGLGIAEDLGLREATTIRYATSADAGGDPDSVTGFAGVIVR